MISIIIPALNEEKYLPLLLDSIKKQSYKDYEIIVADAGSKDKTLEIAKSYGCTIIEGGLPAKGRNSGAKVAKGEYLLFIDSDVVIPEATFLEHSLAFFNQKKLDGAIFPILPLSGKPIDKAALAVWNTWIVAMQKLFPHGASSFLVKKTVHEKIGGFDESVIFAEDQHYIARIAKSFKIGVIKGQPVYISIRRYEKDGHIKTYVKYIFADIYIFFRGPIRSDMFKYRFNHYHEEE